MRLCLPLPRGCSSNQTSILPLLRLLVTGVLLASDALSQRPLLTIENPVGQVRIHVRPIPVFELTSTSPVRDIAADDVKIGRHPDGGPLIQCTPSDGARVDLVVDVPYDTSLSVSTKQGDIYVSGLVGAADISTQNGAIEIATPWRAVDLDLKVDRAPPGVRLPSVVAFRKRERKGSLQLAIQLDPRFHDVHDSHFHKTHSDIRVRAESPRRLVLRDMRIPDDSPFKMHWQAPAVLSELFRPVGQQQLKVRGEGGQKFLEPAAESLVGEEDGLTFRAETRLVSLSVSVTDEEGAPVTDLMPSDFEVFEKDVRQRVESGELEPRRTNFVLMLDWSGSTKAHRELSKDSALRFAELLRPDDRIAVYAMVQTRFQLVCGLTSSRVELGRRLNSLTTMQAMNADWGDSPIFDSLVLSYAQELPSYREEHNILVVVSDGQDNRSLISFEELRRVAAEMYAVIYPVALYGFNSTQSQEESLARGRLRLQILANASGGKLFPAASMADLAPVYPQFAQELKSLYTLTYYPKNQNFDGKWRRLQVKIGRPGASARTRAGYFAR